LQGEKAMLSEQSQSIGKLEAENKRQMPENIPL
jgi:hypothetical protein